MVTTPSATNVPHNMSGPAFVTTSFCLRTAPSRRLLRLQCLTQTNLAYLLCELPQRGSVGMRMIPQYLAGRVHSCPRWGYGSSNFSTVTLLHRHNPRSCNMSSNCSEKFSPNACSSISTSTPVASMSGWTYCH